MRCIGCGGDVPDVDGPIHAYMEASPGCWQLFGELGVRHVPGAPASVVHQVDAYAVQHPGGAERDRRQRQSVAVHLVALCLFHETDLPPEEAIPVRRRALEVVLPRFGLADWPYLTPPASLPSVTVADLFLLGVTGVHHEAGLTTGDADEAAMKRTLAGRAAETYVLASHEKIGAASPYTVVPLRAVGGIITDAPADSAVLAQLRQRGVVILEA